MVFLNNTAATRNFFPLAFATFFLLGVATTFAQAQKEALWRVESTIVSEQVPLYDGHSTPFTIKTPPPAPTPAEIAAQAQAEQVAQLTPEELLAQERAQKAASIISRVRDTLKDDSAFLPDLSGIIIDAIVSGNAGKMAYIKGKWRFAGDYLNAPVITAQDLLNLMVTLETLDKGLADIVRTEVDTRLTNVGPQKVLIKTITEKGMTVRLPRGHERVISFTPRGW